MALQRGEQSRVMQPRAVPNPPCDRDVARESQPGARPWEPG